MRIHYIDGYGVNLDDISPFLKEELSDFSASEFYDRIYDPKHTMNYFDGESSFLYIPTIMPYEESFFKSIEEINNYLYEAIEQFLVDGTSKKDITCLFDEVFDYSF